MEIELKAGVVTVSLRQRGYQSVKEKVSVRSGDITEMEITLEPGDEKEP